MTDTSPATVTASENRPKGLTGLVEDWSSDQRAFQECELAQSNDVDIPVKRYIYF